MTSKSYAMFVSHVFNPQSSLPALERRTMQGTQKHTGQNPQCLTTHPPVHHPGKSIDITGRQRAQYLGCSLRPSVLVSWGCCDEISWPKASLGRKGATSAYSSTPQFIIKESRMLLPGLVKCSTAHSEMDPSISFIKKMSV